MSVRVKVYLTWPLNLPVSQGRIQESVWNLSKKIVFCCISFICIDFESIRISLVLRHLFASGDINHL